MKYVLSFLLLFVGCASKNDTTPQIVEQKTLEKEIMFNGNCPNGLCLKKKVKGDGKYKLEIENKVYFFSSQKALDTFSKDIPGNLKKAQNHWNNHPELR